MTPEERSLLEKTFKLAEENNSILRAMRRSNRYSIIAKVIYWVVILGVAYGAFYFIQPYFQTLVGLTGQATDTLDSLKSVQSSAARVQNTTNSLLDLLK